MGPVGLVGSVGLVGLVELVELPEVRWQCHRHGAGRTDKFGEIGEIFGGPVAVLLAWGRWDRWIRWDRWNRWNL